jgi:hypothetical protein
MGVPDLQNLVTLHVNMGLNLEGFVRAKVCDAPRRT